MKNRTIKWLIAICIIIGPMLLWYALYFWCEKHGIIEEILWMLEYVE